MVGRLTPPPAVCGWRARRVGAVYRGGVVARATARLIFAGWIRRSAVRRTVPHTYGESRLAQNIHGDHFLPRRASPGTPPAWGREGQLVISAHTNPASSRATATTATPAGLPRAVIFLYLACSRCCAFQERASVSGGSPACRRTSVTPIAGRYR